MMFTPKEHSLLTAPYFKLIRQTDDFYEIQSRCTGHCWIIQKPYVFEQYPVRIYHRHGHARNISSAVRQIKNHDAYQLNGRRTVTT